MSEEEAITRAIQSTALAEDLWRLCLTPTDFDGKTVANVGAGLISTLKPSLKRAGINTQLIEIDANPLPETTIQKGKFSALPIDDDSVDLVISHKALPMYLPEDNIDLATQAINEIKRVLKPGGEARLSPWVVASVGEITEVRLDIFTENERPEIFNAMKSVPGLDFELIKETTTRIPGGYEIRTPVEVMIIRKK